MRNYLIVFFIILIFIIVYLVSFSQSSFFTYFELKKDLKENKKILGTYKKQSEKLQKNIEKLESNDLEYLDEIARDKYDLSKPDEIIIFNKK